MVPGLRFWAAERTYGSRFRGGSGAAGWGGGRGGGGGVGEPLRERALALLRQLVVRPLPRLPRPLLRAEVAESLEPLGLRVVVALRRRPVDATGPHHPDEVVR